MHEQGLDRDMVIEAMKDAVRAAARNNLRTRRVIAFGRLEQRGRGDRDSAQKTVS